MTETIPRPAPADRPPAPDLRHAPIERPPVAEGTHPTAPEAAALDPEAPLRVVLVDQSRDAADMARDRADARLDRELTEGGRFKRFVSGIWKGNLAKDVYRQRYVREELTQIQEANDVLIHSDGARRADAIEATVGRFQSDHDELIHREAGESREVLASDNPLAGGVKAIIRRFAEGTIDATAMQEERTRLLNEYRAQHGNEAVGAGIVTTDNMLEIARAVSGAIEHGQSIDHVISSMQVVTGEARDGARTEARYNRVDRVIDRLSKSKVGALVSPTVLAVGVAAAGSILRAGSESAIKAASKTLIPGVAVGIFAGIKENKRVKDERVQHSREMAVGQTFEQGDTRRVEMDRTRYDSVPATELIASLTSRSEAERLSTGGDGALQAALDSLAVIQARVQLSDSRRVDLISYSERESVGEERMMLDLARAQARQSIEANLTDEMRASLGLSDERTLRHVIQERSALHSEVLTGEFSAKDAAFAKLKARRVATATATGIATGILGGLIVQEGIAAFDSTRFGLIDSLRGETPTVLADGQVHQTLLEGFMSGDETVNHVDPSSTYEVYSAGSTGSIELSDDGSLITNPDGTLSIEDGTGVLAVEGLVVDADGAFDQASLDKLEAANMLVEDTSYETSEIITSSTTVDADTYVQENIDQATNVTRDFWYANDTARFDNNELGLWEGVSGNWSGITDEGYQYTVANMEASGSWQGGESVDWNQAASEGNLFVAVSATMDTQSTPFMIPIGPDGTINIPADSPAGHFFGAEDGKVSFNGAYMEVVETASVDPDGTVHIRPLATIVGDNSVGEITVPREEVITTVHPEYKITTPGYETIQENFTEMAPITPVVGRRSMEAARTPEATATPEGRIGGYYNREATEAERQRILDEISPRLRNNPDARLNPREELDWFTGEIRRERGDGYANDLAAFVANNPELSRMDRRAQTIVTIPVAAASESENIYRTLSLFGQQESPEGSATILLNVNWLDTAVSDPEKMRAIQQTLSEIERAKRDFPELSVAVMQKEYSAAETSATGGPIGYITDDLVNTALFAVQSRMSAGQIADDQELLIVRSDADVNGQSRRQLANMHRAIIDNPEIDVVKGATRFGVGDQGKFPGFGIVSNFSTALAMAATQENKIHTGGANFGVRASTLAAIRGLGSGMVEQEDGTFRRESGAGSDDVSLGRRTSTARRIGQGATAGQYSSSGGMEYSTQGADAGSVRRIKLVGGATIDTDADRLLPYYVGGRAFQDAWRSNSGSFTAANGDYRDRDANKAMIEDAEHESYPAAEVYSRIEVNMSEELRFASERSAKRALAVFFGSVPGAYVIHGKLGDKGSDVRFELTDAGRTFIKNRVERENSGHFGSYGLRKQRQLYGNVKAGAKRQPVSTTAPLVSPIA